MALKTGSSEAVQGSFPLLFIALFFSSAFFPRQTMQGAYKTIADINPVSHLVEGIRGLVVDGLTAGHVAAALLIPAAIGVVSDRRSRAHPLLTIGGPMSTTIIVRRPAGQAEGGTLLRSARGLALRGLRSIRRLPSAFFPALAMPIFQTIAFSGTFFAITKIPGFPTDRSVNWYLPLATCMGSASPASASASAPSATSRAGSSTACGWRRRRGLALIIGPLITAWTRVLIVITGVLIVGFLFGARLTGGVLGLVMLYVAGLGVATAAAGWALGLAYRFGDMRAAALMQLTFFTAIFLSDAQTPLNVMTGWLHAVARVNPFTNILRLAREGWLGDVTWDGTWGGLRGDRGDQRADA